MCNAENKCEKPEKLKTKPEECAPEQIKECHGGFLMLWQEAVIWQLQKMMV